MADLKSEIGKVIADAEAEAERIGRWYQSVQLEHKTGVALSNIAGQMTLLRAELTAIRMALIALANKS
jgi:hypothetical protein